MGRLLLWFEVIGYNFGHLLLLQEISFTVNFLCRLSVTVCQCLRLTAKFFGGFTDIS